MEMFVSLWLLALLQVTSAATPITTSTTELDLSFFNEPTSSPPIISTPKTDAPPVLNKPAPPFTGGHAYSSRTNPATNSFAQYPLPSKSMSHSQHSFPFIPSAPQVSYGGYMSPIPGVPSSDHVSPTLISSLPSSPYLPPTYGNSVPLSSSNLQQWNKFYANGLYPSLPQFLSQGPKLSIDPSANVVPSSLNSYLESLVPSLNRASALGNSYTPSRSLLSQAPVSPSIPQTQGFRQINVPVSSDFNRVNFHDILTPASSYPVKTYASSVPHVYSHPVAPSVSLSSPRNRPPGPIVASFVLSYIPLNQFLPLPLSSASQPSVSLLPNSLNTLPSHFPVGDTVSAIVNSYIPSSSLSSSNPALPYIPQHAYNYPQSSVSSIPAASMVSSQARPYSISPMQSSYPFSFAAQPMSQIKFHSPYTSFTTVSSIPSSPTKHLWYTYSG